MNGHQGFGWWPVRRFAVVEDSMRPGLRPGDGLVAIRCGVVRTGQLRVFPDPGRAPGQPPRFFVKRVGAVDGSGRDRVFVARSDNAAPGVVDSRHFGPVPATGSYRVVWTVRVRRRARTEQVRKEQ